MSVAERIKSTIQRIKRGEPFTNARFIKLGSRSAVDKELSRLVEAGTIQRVTRGVFVRPKKSRFVGYVMPEVSRVVEVIAKDRGEVVQIHGAEAARRFKLSTQVPTIPVYYTNGPTREIKVGNQKVRLLHTTNQKKLQHAGKKSGLALSALWYLGHENISAETIERVRSGLTDEEFETLRNSKMPGWMREKLAVYAQESAYV